MHTKPHILLPSRLYCRLRNLTGSAFRLAGCTAGRDLHPALKIACYSIHVYYIQVMRKCQPAPLFGNRFFVFTVNRLISCQSIKKEHTEIEVRHPAKRYGSHKNAKKTVQLAGGLYQPAQNVIGRKEAITESSTAGSRFATRILLPQIRLIPTQKISTLPTSER